jgi:hypothetical protein
MRAHSRGTGLGLALAGASLLLFCAVAAAQAPTLYKWVDKDGHVHYGDSPGDPRAKPINPTVLNNGEDATTTTDPAAVEKKQQECKHKAEEYNRFKAAGGISETDALGNSRTYTAEEKDKLVERKRQDLVQQCGAKAAEPPSGV